MVIAVIGKGVLYCVLAGIRMVHKLILDCQ